MRLFEANFSCSGEYDRKLLTGLSIEARIPKLSLFQGCKIPQVSLETREDSISLPLTSGFHKIVVSAKKSSKSCTVHCKHTQSCSPFSQTK
jgi:hypothetical protein